MTMRCWLGIHDWFYRPNANGGRSTLRVCERCGKRQTWNYELARVRGIIEWVDV